MPRPFKIRTFHRVVRPRFYVQSHRVGVHYGNTFVGLLR